MASAVKQHYRSSSGLIALFLLFTVVNIVFVGQHYLYYLTEGIPVRPSRFAWTAVHWYLWVGLTPVVIWMARQVPIERAALFRRVILHLAGAILVSASAVLVFVSLRFGWTFAISGEVFPFMASLRTAWIQSFFVDLLVYMVIVAIVNASIYYDRYRERDVRTAHLEAQLSRAQLQALRMQLNPHFLFNTLHAVSALTAEDVGAARRVLAHLGTLLRLSLDSVSDYEVTLRKELTFLEHYVKIEQVRFQDRLRVDINVDDEAYDCLVPNLILQPIVENAIKHGVSKVASAGNVEIKARVREDRLELSVLDDGPGISTADRTVVPKGAAAPTDGTVAAERFEERIGQGIGVNNTRDRLRQLYGNRFTFTLENRLEGGVVVTMSIPLRTPLNTGPSGRNGQN